MRHSLFLIGAICMLAVGGCETTEGQNQYFRGEPFKKSDVPHTTAFKYIKNFSGQKVALAQSGGVQTIHYYQGGNNVGTTQFAVDFWFELITEEEIKERLRRVLKQTFPNDDTPSRALSTYRSLEDFGAYTKKTIAYS